VKAFKELEKNIIRKLFQGTTTSSPFPFHTSSLADLTLDPMWPQKDPGIFTLPSSHLRGHTSKLLRRLARHVASSEQAAGMAILTSTEDESCE